MNTLTDLQKAPEDIVERYHFYLDAVTNTCTFLRNEPGYTGLEQLKKCVAGLESVLNQIAGNTPVEEGPVQLIELQIPSSPLVTSLQFHSQGHKKSLDTYMNLLQLSNPTNEDLKELRAALADTESHEIQVTNLKKRIQLVDTFYFDRFSIDQIAQGIYYLSSSLFGNIVPALHKCLADQHTLRFLSFQEYLYSIFSSYLYSKLIHTSTQPKIVEKTREAKKKELGSLWNTVIKVEWLIDICTLLVFKLHDIASASTCLSVIDSFLYNQTNTLVTKPLLEWILENEKYLKLQKLFGEHSVMIEEEILGDMLEHGEMGIIPAVQVVMDHLLDTSSSDIHIQNAFKQWRLISPVAATKDDDFLHFLVTRIYDPEMSTPWWKRYSKCGKVNYEKEEDKVLDRVIQEVLDTVSDSSSVDETNVIADDLYQRFLSLNNKK